MIHAWSRWFIALFTTPFGVVILGALDSTVFFALPFGIDGAVILLAAQLGRNAWIVPLLATLGSLAGAALTFWMGYQIGEHGLERHVPAQRLERVRRKIRKSGAVALAVLDLIPPPFPFTAFVLVAGALEVKRSMFFITLALCRLFRFGLEAALAVIYGKQIVAWMDSDVFQNIVFGFILLAVVLTVVSIVKVIRSTRPARRRRSAA
jgi:membrane protein YqaA with SNARE-associated domain